MKKNLKIIVITILILSSCSISNVNYKKLKVNGDYKHEKAGMIFPETFEDYKREDVFSFNQDLTNIGVTYRNMKSNVDQVFSIYVYPAPAAYEDRIRSEFFISLQNIANNYNQTIEALHKTEKLKKDGYQVLGILANIKTKNQYSILALFECGKYFLKYRITTTMEDSITAQELLDKLFDYFSPIDIVKKNPLIQGATINIAPGFIQDSSTLISVVAGAYAKSKWVYENVDSLERCSGFPSLYFEEQLVAVTEMLKRWDTIPHNNSVHDKYFNDLNLVHQSGFLNEFIFEQFGGILLLPDHIRFDFKNYQKWKETYKPSVRLTGVYSYLIGYTKSYDNNQE